MFCSSQYCFIILKFDYSSQIKSNRTVASSTKRVNKNSCVATSTTLLCIMVIWCVMAKGIKVLTYKGINQHCIAL